MRSMAMARFPCMMAMHLGMMFQQELPPALMVGIGYASAESMMVNRGRDYTPTPVTDQRDVPVVGGLSSGGSWSRN